MKHAAFFEKTFALIGPIWPSALVFALMFFGYCLYAPLPEVSALTFHCLFYLQSFAVFLTLLYYNRAKPAFFLLCLIVAYILINILKNRFPETYFTLPAYQNLLFLLPLNLALFSLLPPRRFFIKQNIIWLLAIFLQFSAGEFLSRAHISLNGGFSGLLSGPALVLAVSLLLLLFIRLAAVGGFLEAGYFFSALAAVIGINASAMPGATALFFCAAVSCLLLSVVIHIYRETYFDPLTGLAGRNAYLLHSKDFPLKYSIGIISLDDFGKLGPRCGRRRFNQLIRLIAGRIAEYEKEDVIYRYNEDEFVILFKNRDKKESFKQLENIRRAVAAASFAVNGRRPPLKVTVSASVSEKKRSDANSFEVLLRARKVLEKTRAFSHNVTSVA